MSVGYLVEIRCDGPDDGPECPDSAAWNAAGQAVVLRKRMREDGWRTGLTGGRDQCPACKPVRSAP